MRIKRKKTSPVSVYALMLSVLMSLLIFASSISAFAQLRDKDTNTAFITKKSARWTDEGNYLAELTLAVNGTQILEPLDVVVVLDRSGSMDMYWHENKNTSAFHPFTGYPSASCPCLNPDHFYLPPVVRAIDLDPDCRYQSSYTYGGDGTINIWLDKYEAGDISDAPTFEGWACSSADGGAIPARDTIYSRLGTKYAPLEDSADYKGYVNLVATYKEEITGAIVFYNEDEDQWYEYGYDIGTPVPGADPAKVYTLVGGNIAVYKSDYNVWTEVSNTQEHLYYQFTEEQLQYVPYHFRKELSGEYTLISRWVDLGFGLGDIYYHADEGLDCFDRWMEAKKAISVFSRHLLDPDTGNPNNSIALVPFSKRDHNMVTDMNIRDKYRDYIIAKNPGAFDPAATGVEVKPDGTLDDTCTYNSRVSWTHDPSDIDDMLDRLFTTANTDYVYGLSMAYNMLEERLQDAKDTKRPVVLFISDGVPYSQERSIYVTNTGNTYNKMVAAFNPDPTIFALTEFLKRPAGTPIEPGGYDGEFWQYIKNTYVPDMHLSAPFNATTCEPGFLNARHSTGTGYWRHDIDLNYLMTDGPDYIGAYGKGAQIVTVAYMIEEKNRGDELRLKNMATDPASYIQIPPSRSGAFEGYLTDRLLENSLFPGGREAVLRDEISKYFYIPDNAVLPDGVTVDGSIETGQTLVWTIGNIYALPADLTITVPLVLREEWRNVERTTYYPTNADDNPEPSIYTPENGPDGPDTGSKLYYTDPEDQERYDTIGTPKLRVRPPAPTEPEPPPTPPTPPIPPVQNETALTLTGTKTASGGSLADGQFGFTVYEGGTVVATGTNTSGGVIHFSEINYTEEGTHTYTVMETSVSNERWRVDDTVYTVTVTVVENEDGTLSAIPAYPAGGLVFNNTYTPPDVLPDENVSLSIRKSLVDSSGNQTGTGKKFAVRLFDSLMNPIGRYILSANEEGIVVSGLESGTSYYLQEEEYNGFNTAGFEIAGIGTARDNAVGFRIPIYENNLEIEIIVTNEAYDLEIIPDDPPPLGWYTPPEDPPMIDIPEDETPLGSVEIDVPETGDSGNIGLWLILLGASALSPVIVMADGRRSGGRGSARSK